MKKKSPVLLITILAVLAGVVFVSNALLRNPLALQQMQAPEQPKQDDAQPKWVTPDTVKQNRERLARSLNQASAQQGLHDDFVPPSTPVIVLPERTQVRATPNDSAPSDMWYDENSRAAKISEEREAERSSGR